MTQILREIVKICRFLERILELFATPKDDMEFRWKLLGLVAANACAAILIEDGFVEIVLRNLWDR